MTNRPKAIGTVGETAVVRVCRSMGFPAAERRALHGNTDLGDVLLCPGIILEVKAGQAAKASSQRLIDEWLAQTETEKVNAGAQYGFLITQRTGYGPARAQHWWAHLSIADIVDISTGHPMPLWSIGDDKIHARIELRHLLLLLRTEGYGNPIVASGEDE